MSFLVSILVFSVVIVIHELGHFVVAKKSGIKVNEFSIGMGPRLAGVKKGETEYSIRALPIGGYVAMEGEDEESDSEGSFSKAPVTNRIAVVVAGAVMNLILGFAILVFMVSRQDAITSRTVSVFHDNAMTQQTGLQIDDEIIAVNGRRCYIANDIIYEFARTQDGVVDLTVRRDGKITELEDVTFETYEDENGMQQLAGLAMEIPSASRSPLSQQRPASVHAKSAGASARSALTTVYLEPYSVYLGLSGIPPSTET